MNKPFDLYSKENFFKMRGKVIIDGNLYIKCNSEFEELVVHGDCVIDGSIKAKKLTVLGDFIANAVVTDELQVHGDAVISKIVVYDIKVVGDLEISILKARYACIFVGGIAETENISGDIIKFSVGKLK